MDCYAVLTSLAEVALATLAEATKEKRMGRRDAPSSLGVRQRQRRNRTPNRYLTALP